ncbi:MAG: hypothetical protein R6U40_11985, partial [Desulfobacterales bacterium]
QGDDAHDEEDEPGVPQNNLRIFHAAFSRDGQGNQGITRPAPRREQIISQIDAEIAEKSNFRMETKYIYELFCYGKSKGSLDINLHGDFTE